MTPRELTKWKMQMRMNSMMMGALWSALIQLAGLVVMILTEPDKPIPPTITKSVIIRNVKNIVGGVPLMLEKKRISIQGKWSCLCFKTPQRKAL